MRLQFLTMALYSALAAAAMTTADAREKRSKVSSPREAVSDCVPINGRYGYYGNPWCDTGSYRQEGYAFRERQAKLRQLKFRRAN